jgi:NAD(P)-dependent dehydrogenase (short-subunit alcohol dehydrogenase family)
MNHRFSGQVVVITGASSGVGRACAREFARRGARIGLIARNTEALDTAAREVENLGGEALLLPLDVSDDQAVHDAADQVVALWGRIDVWVNNAMVTVFAPVTRTTAEEFRRVTDVTYLSYVYGTQAALRHMTPRDRGTIVQVGSALAYRSIPLQSAYCAAKAAIRGFTDSLRTELIYDNSGVKLTMVHLPAVNTPQPVRQRNKMDRQAQPVPPLFTTQCMAEAIVRAAETAPREQLVSWPVVRAVWGQKLAPSLADWYLARGGYDAQFVDAPNDPDAPDILFESQPGDPGSTGPYIDKERGPDWQMALSARPVRSVALAALAVLGSVFAVRRLV